MNDALSKVQKRRKDIFCLAELDKIRHLARIRFDNINDKNRYLIIITRFIKKMKKIELNIKMNKNGKVR